MNRRFNRRLHSTHFPGSRFGNARQRGAVIIIVLWTAVLLTVLVTAMAGKVRLSAQTVIHNQDVSTQWAQQMAVLHKAEAELMLDLMARPVGMQLEETDEGEVRTPAYRFNGQELTELFYPQSDDPDSDPDSDKYVVRIYNHAGKINLNRIPRRNMQMLIEERLGGVENANPDEVQEYLSAWTDWTDLNSLAALGGAEADYYQSLDPGYTPRNNPELDTVDELLHVRGFAELFEGVNLDAAFTIHGNVRTLNLNLATREAMSLIPGMDEEIIENILAFRELEDINNRAEIAEIVPFENLQEMSSWIGNQSSQFYDVFVYRRADPEQVAQVRENSTDEFFNPDPVTQAYTEIIEVRGFNNLPTVLEVNPYGRLPDTAPPRVREEDLLF
jgi:general secretion pathway protein K